MIKSTCLLVGFFLLGIYSFGQTDSNIQLQKKLDEYLSGQFKSTEPGAVALIAKKGQVIYKKAFGIADIELNVPLGPDMIFKLGSITKQFTAVAILQLVEQGIISLQDSLQKYIPDFPSKGYKITIENLLTHTSGIRDYTQIDYSEPYMERRDFTPRQLIDSFKKYPLEFEPGSQFRYSNSGYFLLGYIIEKVSGKSYSTYIHENLLQPLGLKNISFDSLNMIIPNRVNGYRIEGEEFRNADYWSMTIAYSAGGLYSNAEDLLKWQEGLMTYKILKKESLEKAFVSYKLKDGTLTDYGYGWYLKEISGSQSIGHGGAITGFRTVEVYFPAEDIYVVILSNTESAQIDALTTTLSGFALGKAAKNNVSVNDSILNAYVGTYVLQSDKKRKIVIIKEKDHLMANVSGQGSFQVVFQSDTKFEFINIAGARGEFKKENGRVTEFIITQNGVFEWKKID
jgi:CubicO group peptidase (beta-lactamase class C family)